MATSFVGFARLPFELRHTIWESALPSPGSKQMKIYIKGLVEFILTLPRDRYFGYGAPTKLHSDIINNFMRRNASPYADFEGCAESRHVALKHLQKLLLAHETLGPWIANPKFPYTDPELTLHGGEKMVYHCTGITDRLDLNDYVFWEFKRPETPKPYFFNRFASLAEYEEWKEERAAESMKKMEEEDKEWAKDRAAEEEYLRNGEKEFWEHDATAILDISGEEAFVWDDESDTEDNDVPQITSDATARPVLKPTKDTKGATESSISKRKRSRDDCDNIEEEDRSCKRQKS